jgi:hypothetical protein
VAEVAWNPLAADLVFVIAGVALVAAGVIIGIAAP